MWYNRSEVLIEVVTIDVLAALACPFQRDPGILSPHACGLVLPGGR
jgi:hypothetical protein